MLGGRFFKRLIRPVEFRISQTAVPRKRAWYRNCCLFLRLQVLDFRLQGDISRNSGRFGRIHFAPDIGEGGRRQQKAPAGGQGVV